MPPKRKALAEADVNKDTTAPPAKKATRAAKAAKEGPVAKESMKPKETSKASTKTKTSVELKNTSKTASDAKEAAETKGAAKAAATTKKSVEPKEAAKAVSKTKKTTEAEESINAPLTTKKTTASKGKAKAVSEDKEPTESKDTTVVAPKTNKSTASKETARAASGSKKPAETKATKPRKFKYSDAETVSGAPKIDFVNVAWPRSYRDDSESDGDTEEDEEGDPKIGEELTEDMIKRVSKMGYPITSHGIEKFQWMIEEQGKRDQDEHNMYIYNDFSGYGSTEMIENFLSDFNKVLFKKDVSPFKKWAYVEALATWFKLGDLMCWMMNDDFESMCDIMDIFGTMLLTSLDMLSEHGLLAPDSPLPNIGIMSLLIIEFTQGTAGDFGVQWAHEVVRALDKTGVEIGPRKEVRVSQDCLEELRERYKEKEEDEIEDEKNIYKVHSSIKGWEPEDDFDNSGRIWARWNWKKEYAEFRQSHRGGDRYNLEKWSTKKKAEYTFGTEEYEKRMDDMLA